MDGFREFLLSGGTTEGRQLDRHQRRQGSIEILWPGVAFELVCQLVGVSDEVFHRASHVARLLVTRNLASVADLLKPAGKTDRRTISSRST